MPFGRGRNWFGPGFWKWGGGYTPYFGGYWGRGNPFPFCRRFPWLPRWWWANPYYGGWMGAGYPQWGYPLTPGFGSWWTPGIWQYGGSETQTQSK